MSLFSEATVVIVDDEEGILKGCEFVLRSAGISSVITCSSGERALPVVQSSPAQLVLLDIGLPGLDGRRILQQLTSDHPETAVVMLTGTDDVDTIVWCIRAGAFDYLIKPVGRERLLATVRNALEHVRLSDENRRLKHAVSRPAPAARDAFDRIVTRSPRMHALFAYVEAVARSPMPVLITGETGVGKDLFAEAFHRASGRGGAFVPVNVAGVVGTLLADTLFGHVKGAYSGADQERSGLIESAEGGTLFLDEIGDLQPDLQATLLRFLQEGVYLPLGSDSPRRADVRIVAATNHDLEQLVRSGHFRRDLYYRFHTHAIRIPPLRERPEDLALLCEHFAGEAAQALGRPKPRLAASVLDALLGRPFHGNVRELRSLVFDTMSCAAEDTLEAADFGLPDTNRTWDEAAAVLAQLTTLPTMKRAQQSLIDEALRRAGGNQSIAAKLLGMSRQALNNRLRRSDRSRLCA